MPWFNKTMGSYSTPINAFSLVASIKFSDTLYETICIKAHNEDGQKNTCYFLKLLRQDFEISVNRTVLGNQEQRKREKPTLLPSTKDIEQLFAYWLNEIRL